MDLFQTDQMAKTQVFRLLELLLGTSFFVVIVNDYGLIVVDS